QARHATWDLVRAVRDRGRTVVMTTHFMEEAERLCDRVLIIDHGLAAALDTPAALIRSLSAEEHVSFEGTGIDDTVLAIVRAIPEVRGADRSDGRIVVSGDPDQVLAPTLAVLRDSGVAVHDLRTEGPDLEALFLALTGRAMRD
ncbi:MAG TPA: hypothetical protein VJ506_07520, partial [Candidatus Limnocylindrales bacterium]|nr:hypothetical protein [Candidatus Limnocylindrales bacterium]